MLDKLEFNQTEPIVRVNSVTSGLADDDLDVILKANRLPSTFMVPKVESIQHIDWVNYFINYRQKYSDIYNWLCVCVFVYICLCMCLHNNSSVLNHLY